MGWKLTGRTSGTDAEVDGTQHAVRFSQRAIEGDHHRLSMTSGLLTVIAAGTATAGHLAALRWISASKVMLIHNIETKWRTIAGFTAAQEMALDVIGASGYSASHTAGTPAVLTSPTGKKRSDFTTLVMGTDLDARIGTTAALTAGTHTLGTQQLQQDQFAELAAGATVPKGRLDMAWEANENEGGAIQLLTNEGLVWRNLILMGAGGTGRLTVSIDFTVSSVLTKDW